jgi:hypothetical protein
MDANQREQIGIAAVLAAARKVLATRFNLRYTV